MAAYGMRGFEALGFLVAATAVSAPGAWEEPFSIAPSVGMQLNQHQRDLGMGLHFISPYYANGSIAVRLRGNVLFHEHVQDQQTTWTPYTNLSLDLIGVAERIQHSIRLYGEGSLIGLFPSGRFSSESFEFGGYGLFGFEF